MTGTLLKLRAKDAEDVQVISAVLQDAIAPVCDMIYDAESKDFIMVVHRLRRETKMDDGLERICCAVNLVGIEKCQLHNINLSQPSRMLDLLAVVVEGDNITFIFAGDAKIRFKLGGWSMLVEDFGEPWPSHCNPCHDSDAAESLLDGNL
jgi:hypothetical protein